MARTIWGLRLDHSGDPEFGRRQDREGDADRVLLSQGRNKTTVASIARALRRTSTASGQGLRLRRGGTWVNIPPRVCLLWHPLPPPTPPQFFGPPVDALPSPSPTPPLSDRECHYERHDRQGAATLPIGSHSQPVMSQEYTSPPDFRTTRI